MNKVDVSDRTTNGMPYWLGSVFLPGLGQACEYMAARGLLWLSAVTCGYYLSVWAGLALHIFCILDSFHHRNRLRPSSER